MQEVVFVKVSNAGSDFTRHPLQLQRVSVSKLPVLLSQITPKIPLETQIHTPLRTRLSATILTEHIIAAVINNACKYRLRYTEITTWGQQILLASPPS